MQKSTKRILQKFLKEDIGKVDITSKLLPPKKITASIITRQDGIAAGVEYAKEVFLSKGCKVIIHKRDGQEIKANETILNVVGDTYAILSCERTVLNLMSRMSGIATQTKKYVKKIHSVNPKVGLYSTRKTAPGLRIFDKKAIEIGGGHRHRMTLDQMVMIKDNHIAVAGTILRLIKNAKRKYEKIEVEVESTSDAILVAKEGVNIIMLDNMAPKEIRKTIKELEKRGLRKKVRVEASGGINYNNIAKYAKTGIDMISIGRLTNSVEGLDLSLEIN